jgi:hypothetical protein
MTLNKLIPPYFLLFWILQSCQVNNQVNPSVANCTNRSPARLESKNVDNITLSSTPINYDGMLNIAESKGYKFAGKKGQKINYQLQSTTTCAWLYNSDNKVLDTVILPQDGTYILQIANLAGSGTFQLSIKIDNPNKPVEQLPIQTAPIDKDSSTRSRSVRSAESAKSNNSTELGWVRLGSVNNTNGSATVGEKLIRTTQAITINPAEVPNKGDRVTIVNSVNLRADVPQSPTYKLTKQIGIIQPGTKVTIGDLTTFVDLTSSSNYTVVWAKITK